MKVTVDNYEAYVIDYFEHNLSAQEAKSMSDFFKKHPGLKEEAEAILAIEVPVEEISHPSKDQLIAIAGEEESNRKFVILRVAAVGFLLLAFGATFLLTKSGNTPIGMAENEVNTTEEVQKKEATPEVETVDLGEVVAEVQQPRNNTTLSGDETIETSNSVTQPTKGESSHRILAEDKTASDVLERTESGEIIAVQERSTIDVSKAISEVDARDDIAILSTQTLPQRAVSVTDTSLPMLVAPSLIYQSGSSDLLIEDERMGLFSLISETVEKNVGRERMKKIGEALLNRSILGDSE